MLNKKKDKIDEKFDNIEKLWDRFQKLVLKVVGGIVGIALAAYVGYDQIVSKSDEVSNRHSLFDQHHIRESAETHSEDYELTDATYFVDDFGYRKGDTVYVDYYSDGYIEKYYTDSEDYVDDYKEEKDTSIIY